MPVVPILLWLVLISCVLAIVQALRTPGGPRGVYLLLLGADVVLSGLILQREDFDSPFVIVALLAYVLLIPLPVFLPFIALIPSRIRVGADGVMISWLGLFRRFYPYADISGVGLGENGIDLGLKGGKTKKKKVLTNFVFDTSRCLFCALCQEACPTNCIELTQEFEMAVYSRAGLVWDREMLEKGIRTVRYTK